MRNPNNIEEFNQLPIKTKAFILLVITSLFVIGIGTGVALMRSKRADSFQQQSSTLPSPSVSGQPPIVKRHASKLALSPGRSSLTIGENLPVSVILSGEKVQTVDVVLNYNPKYLKLSAIKENKNFPIILRKDIEKDKLSFSASISPDTPDRFADGEIFSFTLTAKEATSAAVVDFDPAMTATAKNGKRFLGTTLTGIYTITKR